MIARIYSRSLEGPMHEHYCLPDNQQRRVFEKVLGRQLKVGLATVQFTAKSFEILKVLSSISSNQSTVMGSSLLGIARMIDKTINEYFAESASEPAIEMGYKMIYAACMRLEGLDIDVASRVDAVLTQGAGIYVGENIRREAGRGGKIRRRMNGRD